MWSKSILNILRKKITKKDIHRAADFVVYNQVFQNRLVIAFLIAFFLIIFAFQAFEHFYTWDTDAPSFYTAAKGILLKVNIYDPQEFQELADSLFGRTIVVFPYLYWPVLAQMFTPFTLLDYSDYFLLLLVFNILITFFCLYLVYRLLDLKNRKNNLPFVFLFLTLAVNRPLHTTLHHGQVNILVFSLILLSLLLLKNKKEFASAFFLCLAAYLKIYPVLFLAWFFFQKRYRYIFYSIVNFGAIFLVSGLLFSFNSWLDFIKMGAGNLFYGTKSEFFFDYNAQWGNNSLNGFLSQFFLSHDLPRNLVMPVILVILLACFLVFRTKIKDLLRKKELNLDASIILTLSLVLSTISWNHHYVIMIFPLTFLFNRIITEKRYGYLPLFTLTAFLILYHNRAGGFPFNLILFFATVLFLILLLHYNFSRREDGVVLPVK